MKKYRYKGSLPDMYLPQLESLGFDRKLLLKITIEIGTINSIFITWLLNSSATVIQNTIYFRNNINDASIETISLIAHEIIHVKQWNNEKYFLASYIKQFITLSFEYIFRKLRDEETGRYWIHDHISFEKEAISFQQEILNNHQANNGKFQDMS